MENNTNIQTSTKKIYKDRAIWIGTFIGGPLVAGYFISENFKAFDEEEKVSKTWLYTIIATFVIFIGSILIPESVNIPNTLIPIIYTAIAYGIVEHLQGQNIKNHISSGGEVHSWWRVIGIGIIGLIVSLVIILCIALLLLE